MLSMLSMLFLGGLAATELVAVYGIHLERALTGTRDGKQAREVLLRRKQALQAELDARSAALRAERREVDQNPDPVRLTGLHSREQALAADRSRFQAELSQTEAMSLERLQTKLMKALPSGPIFLDEVRYPFSNLPEACDRTDWLIRAAERRTPFPEDPRCRFRLLAFLRAKEVLTGSEAGKAALNRLEQERARLQGELDLGRDRERQLFQRGERVEAHRLMDDLLRRQRESQAALQARQAEQREALVRALREKLEKAIGDAAVLIVGLEGDPPPSGPWCDITRFGIEVLDDKATRPFREVCASAHATRPVGQR